MSIRRFRRGDQLPVDLSKVPDRIELKVYEAYDGWRIDRYLDEHIPWRSRTKIQAAIREGVVRKNGDRVPAGNRRVRYGDVVSVELPRPTEDLSVLDTLTLDIIYEDDWFIGVAKPPNLLVHPVGERRFTSVLNILHRMYRNTEEPEKDVVPMLGHRLDAETSGTLLCTKTREAKSRVTKAIMARTTTKRYLALVEGAVEPAIGVIDMPLGPRGDHEITLTRGYDPDPATGQEAVSLYRVAERLPGFDLVEVQLVTGRQHQIRVHFEALGHPLVGDPLYGMRRRLTRDAALKIAARVRSDGGPPPLPATPSCDERFGRADAPRDYSDLPRLSVPNPAWTRRRTMVPADGPDPWIEGREEEHLATQPKASPIQRPIGWNDDPAVLIDRVALHSAELQLDHPFREGPLHLQAPLPGDLQAAVDLLRDPDSATPR